MHDKAHDPFFTEKRGKRIVSRAVPVRSERLHLTGECDVVEFLVDPHGVPLFGREGSAAETGGVSAERRLT